VEANASVEIFPTMIFSEDYELLRPYGLIGVGVFHFNPKGSLTDAAEIKLVSFASIAYQGQGMPEYRSKPELTQLNIPMGGGLKFCFRQGKAVWFCTAKHLQLH
jgi:hypothetical protein